MGNGTSVSERLNAAGVDFRSLSVSFVLPGGATLTPEVATTTSTRVTLTLNWNGISVGISPPLHVDAPWYACDVDFSGLEYRFGVEGLPVMEARAVGLFTIQTQMVSGTRGRVTEVHLTDTETVGFGAQGTVRERIEDWFNSLLHGTNFERRGYNPLTDRRPQQTLEQLANRMSAGPSTGPLTTADLTGLSVSLSVVTQSAVSMGHDDGSMEIPSGAYITLGVELAGTAAEVAAHNVRVNYVRLSGSQIFLLEGGQRVVQLKSLRVENGCNVRIESFEAVGGAARDLEGADAAVGLVALIVVLSGGVPSDRLAASRIDPDALNPRIGRGLTQAVVQAKLSAGIREFYRLNVAHLQSVLPAGINLDNAFGATCRQ